MRCILKSSLTAFFVPLFVLAANNRNPLRPLRTETPPVIDGKLDDAVWENAPRVTGFKTWMPDYDIDMAEKTVVYTAYDRENLYFAFRCYDSQPDKIKTSVTARDNIRADDWVCINLDSFNDHQSLYSLYINPAGIQEDSKSSSGTFNEDKSIDLVWYSGGQIDHEGYTIEVKVPFKSIRFTNKDPVEMGVIFERRICRRSESGTFPPLSPEKGFDFLTQGITVIFHDIKHYTLFELLPAITTSERHSAAEGKLVSEGKESDLSLTTKYGITSNLILDGTYNPDFSQVEADAGQIDINLRYALYFPEKRPFFLEGSEYFRFAGSSTSDPLRAVVHTRTIIDPFVGVKLSGKIGEKGIIASTYALDELPDDEGEKPKKEYAQVAVLRYKHALHEDSFIGGIYTGRDDENSTNRVLGIDGQTRINASSSLGYYVLGTLNKEGDQTEREEGYALGYAYAYGTRDLNINVGLQNISKDFHTETGYITRTGIFLVRASVVPKFYPNSTVIRRVDLNISNAFVRDKFDGLDETNNSVSLQFRLWRNSNITMSSNYSTEVFLAQTFNTSGLRISGSSQFTKQFYFKLSYTVGKAIYYSEDPYQGKSNSASADVIYHPSNKLHFNLSLVYSDFYRDTDSRKIFDYTIARGRMTYQMNRYLFFRGIVEYNTYREELLTDFLASFTYIPGTVVHFGYGSLYEKIRWESGDYVPADQFLQTKRGFFFKTSYLWRM